ncbi:hypothetical protein [Nocardioides pacificus]
MTGTWYFLLMLFLLAGVWWLEKNRRRLARRARAKGDEWGKGIAERAKANNLPAALDALGRSVVLRADHGSALALVDGVVDSRRTYQRRGPGVWLVDFARSDDLVVEAVPGSGGTEVVLTSIRESSGAPGSPMWTQFLDRVVKAAGKQDIPSEERAGAVYERRAVAGEDEQTWFRA